MGGLLLTVGRKARLIAAWRQQLLARRAVAESQQAAARSGTRVDGTHRPENRGERGAVTTQGYLAQGYAERMAALDEALRILDLVGDAPREVVSVGALVRLDDDRRFLLLPGGDATWIADEDARVRVISAAAPIAAAMLGREAGDEVTLPTGTHELVEVS